MLDYGADPKVTDELGRTPAFYLGSSSSSKGSTSQFNFSVLTKLLSSEIIDWRDVDGEPLIHALTKSYSKHSDVSNFKRIVTCIAANPVADLSIQDFQNPTALHLHAAYGERVFAQVLLQHGADMKAEDNDGNIPLDVAVQCKQWKFVGNILRWGQPKFNQGVKSYKGDPQNAVTRRRRNSLPNLPWTPECF